MIKACIIGISGYGRIHYDLLIAAHAAKNLEVVGAAIINQDEEKERCDNLRSIGCQLFDDYQVMLDTLTGTAEFCMIPTGTPLHRPMTVAALEAGMNVLVEKPAAGCIEDVRAMLGAQEEAGKIVAVGYQHMYAPATMAVKRHILEGTIGELESIKCLVTWPRDHAYYNRNGWAGKLAVNGTTVNDTPFNNAVAHDLMMMLFQAGATEREAAMPVSVEAQLYRANAIESADTVCMCVQTAERVPIRFYATHACRENFGPEIHIRGSKGTIVMTHNGSVIRPDGGESIARSTGGGNGSRNGMMDAVLDAIQGGSSFICDLEIASRQTMVVNMIHQACTVHPANGETERLERGSSRTYIPGIEDALRNAFDDESLLRNDGVLVAEELMS